VVTDARPRSADERDAFGVKTAADESEDLCRRLVQPLGIVDDTDERLLFGDTRAQRQGGEPDEEPVRRGTFAESEDGRERVALGSGELVEVIQHGPAELMQPAISEFHLGLDADGSGDMEVLDTLSEVAEQRALAHPGFTAEHDDPTFTGENVRQEAIERITLILTPYERHRRQPPHARRFQSEPYSCFH
jgi:hypothetical protein